MGTRRARRTATLPPTFEKTSTNPTDSQQPTNKEKKETPFFEIFNPILEEERGDGRDRSSVPAARRGSNSQPQGPNHAAIAAATVRRSGFLIVELLELTRCLESRILTLQLVGFASGVWSARVLRCKEESATWVYW
ncbi:hypothetical protein KY290_005032 [Solanum tuberosum]|uniref:Uncharacterized protein n=1 Tax=Solanum tuberosum TaxID=4113 RepID=A0ABQ7WF15_SOLTU|nr:hypothetical protein KY285_004948 [Solanum tuberosum]KAH0778605.1 hypothetical protein KY290_005032 [Solanum tuberosum]